MEYHDLWEEPFPIFWWSQYNTRQEPCCKGMLEGRLNMRLCKILGTDILYAAMTAQYRRSLPNVNLNITPCNVCILCVCILSWLPCAVLLILAPVLQEVSMSYAIKCSEAGVFMVSVLYCLEQPYDVILLDLAWNTQVDRAFACVRFLFFLQAARRRILSRESASASFSAELFCRSQHVW